MVITFYSYKGGVGRSMALANVAELFFQAGLRVLMIDWDLEAPGLERFFEIGALPQTTDQVGLIDMLLEYKDYMRRSEDDDSSPFPEDPSRYIIPAHSSNSGSGQLLLLTAGRRSDLHFSDYAQSVLQFDWQDFYETWEGERYFEWLRSRLESIADVILIDSRTGVTEMGGVCTYQLADIIVMFCTATQQSIDGTVQMARNFTSDEVMELRSDRPPRVIVVPARVEDRSENDLFVEFRNEFLTKFDTLNYHIGALPIEADVMWLMRIPHVPHYAFREDVVVRRSAEKRHEDMYDAFVKLKNALARMMSNSVTSSIPDLENLPAPKQSSAVLVGKESKYRLSKAKTSIGRSNRRLGLSPEVDLSDEPLGNSVSRFHAEIILIGSQWQLEAKSTTNGTWVENEKLDVGQRKVLSDGDRITLGGVVLTFRLGTVG